MYHSIVFIHFFLSVHKPSSDSATSRRLSAVLASSTVMMDSGRASIKISLNNTYPSETPSVLYRWHGTVSLSGRHKAASLTATGALYCIEFGRCCEGFCPSSLGNISPCCRQKLLGYMGVGWHCTADKRRGDLSRVFGTLIRIIRIIMLFHGIKNTSSVKSIR